MLIRIKKKAVKDADSSVRIIGDGKKTIDRAEIEEAFKQLQLAVDLSNLKRLAEIRNDLEHMHPNHAPALIQEAIADAMPIIRDIIVKELHEEPSAVLGNDAWDALLNEARVFKQEQRACKESFDGIDWEIETLGDAFKDFKCPKCSSPLIRNDNKLLKDYAATQGFAVAQEYVDVETAKQVGRAAFGEMVAYLKAHPAVRVMLVEKTNRLYRNLKDRVTVDEVEIHFPKEGAVLSRDSRSSEKFMHGIKVLMAKNYIDNLSEETRKGMTEKAEQGLWPSNAPLGYRNVTGADGRKTIVLD